MKALSSPETDIINWIWATDFIWMSHCYRSLCRADSEEGSRWTWACSEDVCFKYLFRDKWLENEAVFICFCHHKSLGFKQLWQIVINWHSWHETGKTCQFFWPSTKAEQKRLCHWNCHVAVWSTNKSTPEHDRVSGGNIPDRAGDQPDIGFDSGQLPARIRMFTLQCCQCKHTNLIRPAMQPNLGTAQCTETEILGWILIRLAHQWDIP